MDIGKSISTAIPNEWRRSEEKKSYDEKDEDQKIDVLRFIAWIYAV